MRVFALPIVTALVFGLCAPVRAAVPKAAVFDFELVDTSLEGATNGPRADEQARLARTGDQLRQRLTQSGRFSVVDTATSFGRRLYSSP